MMISIRDLILSISTVVILHGILFSCNPAEDNSIEQTTFLWEDKTSTYLPVTAEWTNRVEVADINGDNLPDLLFANGGNYSSPGKAEPARVFINQGPGKMFLEDTTLFGDRKFYARVIKVIDINNDNIPDIVVGNTYQTQSELYFGLGEGKFERVTESHFPAMDVSIGDLEIGDVNSDGYLDIALADWGTGDAMQNEGGMVKLWLNDGEGYFKDVTETHMPDLLVEFSWDIEFFDYDNDFDLDLLIACKRCGTSKIYANDGTGNFTYKRLLPAYTNNYDFEIMDINKDGYLDLITINDGEIVDGVSWSRREHVFINDSAKRFLDKTHELWPDNENIGADDNNNVFLDYDSDGDADFITSSLTGLERLSINDGAGNFTLKQPILSGPETPLTLSLVIADLNGDHKLDIVMGQGEGEEGIEERIYIGTNVQPDTAAPEITHISYSVDSISSMVTVKARIHDRKSPSVSGDWKGVSIIDVDSIKISTMKWYGEYLWTAKITEAQLTGSTLQAIDAAGNVTYKKVIE
jgi:hypothetical protein